MKILIYGINYTPELTGIGKYSGELGSWLANRRHEVRVITAPPYYPDWAIQPPYKNRYFSEEINGVQVYRCPLYVPKSISTSKRLSHLFSFALSSIPKVIAQFFWKPDVIFCVIPTMFYAPIALFLSKLSGAQFVLHIQDYEVDAMLGLGMTKPGFIGRIAKWYERRCLSSADVISTISASMMDKAITKGAIAEQLYFFPNWSNLESFLNVCSDRKNELLSRLNLPTDKKICLYSGNIGEKQGLDVVLDAATRLGSNALFVFCGQGSGLESLKKSVSEKELTNVRFYPLQPLDDLPALLSIADCHLVIQKKGVADAVLPSKLTNILAIGGQAVITAEKGTELEKLCTQYQGIAELIEPEKSDELVPAIQRVLTKNKFNPIAQNYAKTNLDKDTLLESFEEMLKS